MLELHYSPFSNLQYYNKIYAGKNLCLRGFNTNSLYLTLPHSAELYSCFSLNMLRRVPLILKQTFPVLTDLNSRIHFFTDLGALSSPNELNIGQCLGFGLLFRIGQGVKLELNLQRAFSFNQNTINLDNGLSFSLSVTDWSLNYMNFSVFWMVFEKSAGIELGGVGLSMTGKYITIRQGHSQKFRHPLASVIKVSLYFATHPARRYFF